MKGKFVNLDSNGVIDHCLDSDWNNRPVDGREIQYAHIRPVAFVIGNSSQTRPYGLGQKRGIYTLTVGSAIFIRIVYS